MARYLGGVSAIRIPKSCACYYVLSMRFVYIYTRTIGALLVHVVNPYRRTMSTSYGFVLPSTLRRISPLKDTRDLTVREQQSYRSFLHVE